MKTEIYYFTATGNCLLAAKEIAEKLDGGFHSIAALRDEKAIHLEAGAVGLVFPSYFATNGESGLPLTVVRFIQKLSGLSGVYVFAVTTSGGVPGSTIANCASLVASCGGHLAAGFTLGICTNTPGVIEKLGQFFLGKKADLSDAAALRQSSKWSVHQALWENKIESICAYVRSQKKGLYESRSMFFKLLWLPLLALESPLFRARYEGLSGKKGLPFRSLVAASDRGFTVNALCTGCGICAKVCPAGNIQMEKGRPLYHHDCETCLACYQWCPVNAIGGPLVEYNPRYHHPEVTVSELFV